MIAEVLIESLNILLGIDTLQQYSIYYHIESGSIRTSTKECLLANCVYIKICLFYSI